MYNIKSKKERLEIVINICKKLKYFELPDRTIDLYNSNYNAIIQIKKVMSEYVKQEGENISGYSGLIPFPEFNKKIEYRFPIKKNLQPMFVFRSFEY